MNLRSRFEAEGKAMRKYLKNIRIDALRVVLRSLHVKRDEKKAGLKMALPIFKVKSNELLFFYFFCGPCKTEQAETHKKQSGWFGNWGSLTIVAESFNILNFITGGS